jgi:lysozyme
MTIFTVKDDEISLSQAPRDDAAAVGVLLNGDRVEQIGDPESSGWVKVTLLPEKKLEGFLPLRALESEAPPTPDIDAEQFYAAAALTARVSAVDDEYLYGLAVALSGLKNIPSSVAGSDGFGPFQFSIARWADLVGRFGADEDITVDARSDPFAQVVIAARYARLLTDSLKTALRRDPQLNELFLAHLLGADAAPGVLAAPLPATSVDAASQGKPGAADVQKAVADNPQIFQNGNQTPIAQALAAAAAKLQLGLNAASQLKAKLNPPGAPAPGQQQNLVEAFKKLMIPLEGLRKDVYTDSLGKLTVGIGHLVLASDNLKLGQLISDEQVTTLFEKDSAMALSAAQLQANQAGISDPNFVPILGSVNFQLGTHWNITKFPQTWAMIVAGRYEDAAKALDGTAWAHQTPNRVKDFQDALRRLPAKQ